MFRHITANWRGRPLTSYQVVIETIAATTTKTGLTIGAELDRGSYDLGINVTPAQFHALPITPDAFHGDWNYTLAPVSPRTPDALTSTRRINPNLTTTLTDPALTGMSRAAFEHLVAISELHRIHITPMPGPAARTVEQLHARATSTEARD